MNNNTGSSPQQNNDKSKQAARSFPTMPLGGKVPSTPQTPLPTPPSRPRMPLPWRPIPPKLKQLDDNKFVQRLEQLRMDCERRSPEEMYLLLNTAEIGDAIEIQFGQKARKLEGWRNICVLLPLMITWISLGIAGAAFVQSVHVNTKVTAQSFFSLWISGFPDLKSVQIIGRLSLPLVIAGQRLFTFSSITVLDFFLLLFVVLLTWRAHHIDNQAHHDAIELSTWLREEFDQLCQGSRVHSLGPGPENKRPQWAVEVHTAIQNLHEVLDSIKKVTSESQSHFTETIERFTDTYHQQNQSVDKLINNADNVGVSIDNLKTMFGRSESTYQRLETILPQIDQQITKLASQQETATMALQGIAAEITSSSQAIIELARPFAVKGLANMADSMENHFNS